MDGGAGPDTFRFSTGFGADIIRNFAVGSDKLDISNSGITAARFPGSVRITRGFTGTVVQIGTQTIQLPSVAFGLLTAQDFILA